MKKHPARESQVTGIRQDADAFLSALAGMLLFVVVVALFLGLIFFFVKFVKWAVYV